MTTDKSPALSLQGISKIFPGVKALDQVQLNLYAGEVTALVGENGAGKSTLVKIITGIYQPEEGELVLEGKSLAFKNPHSAHESGITAIHQETILFDELTVAENIYAGAYPVKKNGSIDWKFMYREAQKILDSIDAPIQSTDTLSRLSIGQKHLVAIARALSIDAKVVILDEPTAALSHHEIAELYRIVNQLKTAGKAILFITHKFDEIFAIADRYTVFRDGRFVGEGFIRDVSEESLVEMMVARSVDETYPKVAAEIGGITLAVKGLCHPTEFKDINLHVHKGEILGLYGLVGSGRTEVMQAIFGMKKNLSGSIIIDGIEVKLHSPADAIEAGVVYVPEERQLQGAILDMPIFQNISLPQLKKMNSSGFLQAEREFELAREYGNRLRVKTASWSEQVQNLSGGNQQKVVIAKWLATQPKVIILDEPTKGIDIGSKAAVHEFMSELVQAGLSVIMVSSELPEVLGMADRIMVMNEGLVVGELSRNEASPEKVVALATGAQHAA
ncbi:MAG: sugar ABC transporter ATP-binding protein [Reinekea sp.]|jgi:rhamnose transport system ATP-binding protein